MLDNISKHKSVLLWQTGGLFKCSNVINYHKIKKK